MNNFFISPLIPFNIYLEIIKYGTLNKLNKNQIEAIQNLFNYSEIYSDCFRANIIDIISIIDHINNNTNKLVDKIDFVKQNNYLEITNYNQIIYNLLISRNYKQVKIIKEKKEITLCYGLSDIGKVSEYNYFNTLKTDKEKLKFIQKILLNKPYNTFNISRDIMNKSQIDSKINMLTRIFSNKAILYNLLENEKFIPFSYIFNLNDVENYETIIKIIYDFKKDSEFEYFVIKPAAGSLSDGVGIFPVKILDVEFIKKWINDPKNNKYASTNIDSNIYSSWILSNFIQSFLWKINRPISNMSQKFNILNNTFDDKIGRINKFRFWGLWRVLNGEFISYLFKKGYVEISNEELTDYSKNQINPENAHEYYSNLFNLSDDNKENEFWKIYNKDTKTTEDIKLEASTIGPYLDFSKIIDENNYPLGSDKWKIVIDQIKYIINTIYSKSKRYISCMNMDSIYENKGCFSYFALDILIDKNNKAWLLEVNSRPWIGLEENIIKKYSLDKHVLNVNNFLNNILALTIDVVHPPGKDFSNNLENFIETMRDYIKDRNNIYIPTTLALQKTATAKVYNLMFNILDHNNYDAYSYPDFIKKDYIMFRGMTPIMQYLVSKIKQISPEKYLALIRYLFPDDAKSNLINRISTLNFYLGNKSELTEILKNKIDKWYYIIPYSINIDTNFLNKEDIISEINKNNLQNTILIAKPAYGKQGIGIYISNNINELVDYILSYKNENEWIISKYLHNPYLVKLNKIGLGLTYNDKIGRKSHIRSYVLLYKKDNKLNVYMYDKSLIFCAAKEYNTCTEKDFNFCNLTNLYYGSLYYSKKGKKSEDAYKDLSNIAEDILPPNDYELINNQIKNIIKLVIYAVKFNLICINEPNSCYQYIAFDFHIENENGKPKVWLLEVNSTPGLKAPDYQWQKYLGINNFFKSLFNIVLDIPLEKEYKQLFNPLVYFIVPSQKDKLIFDDIIKFKLLYKDN